MPVEPSLKWKKNWRFPFHICSTSIQAGKHLLTCFCDRLSSCRDIMRVLLRNSIYQGSLGPGVVHGELGYPLQPSCVQFKAYWLLLADDIVRHLYGLRVAFFLSPNLKIFGKMLPSFEVFHRPDADVHLPQGGFRTWSTIVYPRCSLQKWWGILYDTLDTLIWRRHCSPTTRRSS